MVSPADLEWFAGFFEGEGSICITQREARGKKKQTFLEPVVAISNTNYDAILQCSKILNLWSLDYAIGVNNKRNEVNRLPVFSIQISNFMDIELFCSYIESYVECDSVRLSAMKRFSQSRFTRKRGSSISQEEWNLYWVIKNRKSSEEETDKLLSVSNNWLAGILEAEGSIYRSPSGCLYLNVSNTNPVIIQKAAKNIMELGIAAIEYKHSGNGVNHQPHSELVVSEEIRVRQIMKAIFPLLRYRHDEWKVLIP